MIYFIDRGPVLSVQSKALPGNAWLWAQLPAAAQKSVASTPLQGMMGDVVCLLCVKWSMAAPVCEKTVRVSVPLSTGEYQGRRKKKKNSRRPRRVAAFSLFTGFNIHTRMDSWKLLHRLANHSPAARVCACRWACAWMLGTGYSSPSGPRNNKHDGSARRRWDGRGQMVTKSQCGLNVIMKRRLTKRRLKILTNTAVLKAGSTFVTKRHCLCLSLETDAEGCGWKTHNSDATRRD